MTERNWLRPIKFIAVAGGLVALSYAICGMPFYETNDDAYMTAICSGVGYCNSPDEHILFSHVGLGFLLKALYTAAPSLPWYALHFVLAQVVAVAAIVASFWKAERSRNENLAMIAAAFVLAAVRPVEMMQFTTTAGLLAIAGWLVLRTEEKTRPTDAQLALGGTLLLWSALIRHQATMFVVLLGFAYELLTGVQAGIQEKHWKHLKHSAMIFIAAGAICFAVDATNKAYYSTDDWKDFYDLNSLQAQGMEFGRNQQTDPLIAKAYSSIGWTKAESNLFESWYLLNADAFNEKNLRTLCAQRPLIPTKINWHEQKDKILELVLDKTLILSLVALIILLSLNRYSLASTLYLVLALALCEFLLVSFKLPVRVFSLAVGFSCVFFLKDLNIFDGKTRLRKFLSATLAFALGGTALYSVVAFREQSSKFTDKNASYKNAMEKIRANGETKIVDWAGGAHPELISPFENPKAVYRDVQLLAINGQGRSPIVMKRLQEWNLDPNMCNLDDKPFSVALSAEGLSGYIDQYRLKTCSKTGF